MPNRRLTILRNANQSISLFSFASLEDDPYSMRDHILTQQRNKFWVKELNIVYRCGGEVVYDGEAFRNRLKVLVSKGEAYIGPPEKHTRTDGKAGEVSMQVRVSYMEM